MINEKNVIDAKTLKSKINKGEHIQIIDIREKVNYENPIENSEWIPASKILENLSKIKRDIPVILYCRLGVESFMLANILNTNFKYTNILNLKSGIEAWNKLL